MYISDNFIKILKYMLYSGIIYIIFYATPEKKMKFIEIFLCVVILTSSFAIFDFICPCKQIITRSSYNNVTDTTKLEEYKSCPCVEKFEENDSSKKSKEIKKINEMEYSEYPKKAHEPLGKPDETISNKWRDENDYAILNTDKWTVPVRRPPVCITEQKCPVCPSMTSGPVSLKDWNNFTTISRPLGINTEYTKKILNQNK